MYTYKGKHRHNGIYIFRLYYLDVHRQNVIQYPYAIE